MGINDFQLLVTLVSADLGKSLKEKGGFGTQETILQNEIPVGGLERTNERVETPRLRCVLPEARGLGRPRRKTRDCLSWVLRDEE